MFNLGSGELLVILFLGLLFLGPKELGQLARWLGAVWRDINQFAIKIRRDINTALNVDARSTETFDPREITKDAISNKLRQIKETKDE